MEDTFLSVKNNDNIFLAGFVLEEITKEHEMHIVYIKELDSLFACKQFLEPIREVNFFEMIDAYVINSFRDFKEKNVSFNKAMENFFIKKKSNNYKVDSTKYSYFIIG